MDSMVERVARAMDAKRRELVAQPLARIWPQLAEAAIEAMRAPTPEMASAGAAYLYDYQGASAMVVWHDMIDAALKEPTDA